MDADEVVPINTAEKIIDAISHSHDYAGFDILRRECVFDVPLRNYLGSCFQLRIAKKEKGLNRGGIHEDLIADGRVGRIDGEILHFNVSSISSIASL